MKKKLLDKQKVSRQPSSDGDGSDYKDDEEEEQVDNTNGKKMRIV